MADPWIKLFMGLAAGFVFGFVLQKAQVTKFPVIVGQFLLRDFTVMKTMLTAIVVGGAGVYILKSIGLASLSVKPAQLAAVAGGGLIFGVGMVLLGYCPGTGVAAAAEGRRDALFGVIGMLVGAALFAEFYAGLSQTILKWWDLGQVTLPELTGISAWVFFGLVAVMLAGVGRIWRSAPGSDG